MATCEMMMMKMVTMVMMMNIFILVDLFLHLSRFFIVVDDDDDGNHLHLGQPPALVLQQCKDLAPEPESG